MRLSRTLGGRRLRILLLSGMFLLVFLPFLSPIHLGQGACPAKEITGREIGTCGLTRSFLAIGRGDIEEAFARNPIGPFLFLFFAKSYLIGIAEEWSRREIDDRAPRMLQDGPLVLTMALALVALTIVRIFGFLEAGDASAP